MLQVAVPVGKKECQSVHVHVYVYVISMCMASARYQVYLPKKGEGRNERERKIRKGGKERKGSSTTGNGQYKRLACRGTLLLHIPTPIVPSRRFCILLEIPWCL